MTIEHQRELDWLNNEMHQKEAQIGMMAQQQIDQMAVETS
jgi:hypothetical protein